MDLTAAPQTEDAGLGLRNLEPELLGTGGTAKAQQHGHPVPAASAPRPASKQEKDMGTAS